MGSITIEVDDEEQQFRGRKVVECNSCGETHSEENVEDGFCSNCEEETEWRVIAEEIHYNTRSLLTGVETIDEMVASLETRAKQLRILDIEGFSLRGPIRKSHAILRREK